MEFHGRSPLDEVAARDRRRQETRDPNFLAQESTTRVAWCNGCRWEETDNRTAMMVIARFAGGYPFGSPRRNAHGATFACCSLLIRTPPLGFLAVIFLKTGRRDFGTRLRDSESESYGFGGEERQGHRAGFPSAGFTTWALEHHCTVLFDAAWPRGFFAFAHTLAGTSLRFVSAWISFVWRERHCRCRGGPFESAEGNVSVWLAGCGGTARRFALEDRRRADSVSGYFLLPCRSAHLSVVRSAIDCRWALQCAAFWLEESSSVRRADSGELFAGFRAEQLAESSSSTSVADLSVRRNVRDALTYFRRSNGSRAGPAERATDDGDVAGRGAFQTADRSDFVRGDRAGVL